MSDEADVKLLNSEEVAPSPKRVRVLPPFLVAHEGTAYWPKAVVEVPEAVAAHWILNGWVVTADEGE